MNRYNIRIDGDVMPNSYSYEELLLNDILEFDDIEVKQESNDNWTNIKSFYFPEEHDEEEVKTYDFYVDENGQAHFQNRESQKAEKQNEFVINEFGEMVQQGHSDSETQSRQTGNQSGSTSSSGKSDSNTGWKVFFTIIAIVAFIAITCTTGWGAIPAGIVGYYTLKTIWGNDL